VFENDEPFAVIAFCQHEHKINIMEVLIAPEKRGQGKGTKLLKELLNSKGIIGFRIQKSEAVIYPSNIASQKAFENAGFKYLHNHKDRSGDSMHYIYESSPLGTD
jgi:RimJ/RimL family protein N-acetyltransferase